MILFVSRQLLEQKRSVSRLIAPYTGCHTTKHGQDGRVREWGGEGLGDIHAQHNAHRIHARKQKPTFFAFRGKCSAFSSSNTFS